MGVKAPKNCLSSSNIKNLAKILLTKGSDRFQELANVWI